MADLVAHLDRVVEAVDLLGLDDELVGQLGQACRRAAAGEGEPVVEPADRQLLALRPRRGREDGVLPRFPDPRRHPEVRAHLGHRRDVTGGVVARQRDRPASGGHRRHRVDQLADRRSKRNPLAHGSAEPVRLLFGRVPPRVVHQPVRGDLVSHAIGKHRQHRGIFLAGLQRTLDVCLLHRRIRQTVDEVAHVVGE